MKKLLLSMLALSCSAATAWASYETSKSLATPLEAITQTSTTAESNDVDRYVDAYRVTGDRVIFRTGPGKQYKQVRYYDGAPIYFYKGDIVLPAYKGVKNGYRHVFIPNSDIDSGWVAVQYLKYVKWDDGYDY